ncbi:MAG TPA: hypothetical protein VGR90_09195, partial [Acidimicrobiales bacterium]|nr:hypothetical protein [Acidimicrobiales bacterium]
DGRTPSELWRDNFLGCFITDPTALRTAERVGVGTVAWECDYPHSDSTWPRSPEQLWEELRGAGLTDADTVDMMTWQNASRFFRFDPFRHRSRADATVGALRATATDVDVRVTSRTEYRRRYEAAHGAS